MKFIISGSSMRFMEKEGLSEKSPLFGRRTKNCYKLFQKHSHKTELLKRIRKGTTNESHSF